MMRKRQTFPTHPNHTHNAKISIDQKQKAFLRATKDIKKGEEIFIDYGFEYWDFFYKEHLKLK
jgi:SET domain-containing protein